MKNNEMFNLLIVDAQNDFCDPFDGTLYVKGADTDCKNIKQFIEENGGKIKRIVLTIDFHEINHCSFSDVWGDKNEIVSTPFEEWDEKHKNVQPDDMPGVVGDNIITWPRHCIEHSWGAALNNFVADACIDFKKKYPERELLIFTKGYNIEEYTPFQRYEIAYTPEELRFLCDTKTPLVVAGEAADVCVKNCVRALMRRYDHTDITVLADCTSAVSSDFSFETDEVYKELVEKGGQIRTYQTTRKIDAESSVPHVNCAEHTEN